MKTRDFIRVDYAVGASISYGEQKAICSTSNLSLRGMFLRTGFDVPANAPVNITVYNTDRSSFKVNATVVWQGDSGIGIQITGLNVDSFARLRDIIATKSKDQAAVLQETFKMLKYISN